MADSDDEQDLCGHPGSNGPCGNPATEPDGSCWLDTHGDDPAESEADGRGAPEGNDHADGNPGGGAPEGNFNAIETGLHTSVKRRLDWFKELGEPYLSLFEDYYVEFHGKAENKSQAAALASLAVIRDELDRNLVVDGVFYEDQIADPEELIEAGIPPEEAQDKAFVEKPKIATLDGLDKIEKELRLGLKYEGVNDNRGGGGATGHDGKSAMWEGDEGEV